MCWNINQCGDCMNMRKLPTGIEQWWVTEFMDDMTPLICLERAAIVHCDQCACDLFIRDEGTPGAPIPIYMHGDYQMQHLEVS